MRLQNNDISEPELLRIFPEAKYILDEKIEDWNRIKGKVFCKEIEPTLKRIAQVKDDFSRWFWLRAYTACYLPERFTEATKQLNRLKRMKYLATDSKKLSRTENFAKSKEIARQKPILSLYPFKKLRKVGMRYQAICPFHNEDTPSFIIYPDNSFHCFGCQANGDAIDFMKLLKSCDFKEAVGSLAGVAL